MVVKTTILWRAKWNTWRTQAWLREEKVNYRPPHAALKPLPLSVCRECVLHDDQEGPLIALHGFAKTLKQDSASAQPVMQLVWCARPAVPGIRLLAAYQGRTWS